MPEKARPHDRPARKSDRHSERRRVERRKQQVPVLLDTRVPGERRDEPAEREEESQ